MRRWNRPEAKGAIGNSSVQRYTETAFSFVLHPFIYRENVVSEHCYFISAGELRATVGDDTDHRRGKKTSTAEMEIKAPPGNSRPCERAPPDRACQTGCRGRLQGRTGFTDSSRTELPLRKSAPVSRLYLQ